MQRGAEMLEMLRNGGLGKGQKWQCRQTRSPPAPLWLSGCGKYREAAVKGREPKLSESKKLERSW